jgi:tetratricopeptide (TPR) repeat protein
VKALLVGVVSNPVTVQIKNTNVPVSVLNTIDMQLLLGNYYLEAKDPEKALDFSKEVLKKEPKSINGLVLRGESNILKKNYTQALADFIKALNEHKRRFPNRYEPPGYLVSTIAWLQKVRKLPPQ